MFTSLILGSVVGDAGLGCLGMELGLGAEVCCQGKTGAQCVALQKPPAISPCNSMESMEVVVYKDIMRKLLPPSPADTIQPIPMSEATVTF